MVLYSLPVVFTHTHIHTHAPGSQLFERDVHKRIGCSLDGMLAFKTHPFFEDIEWAKIITVSYRLVRASVPVLSIAGLEMGFIL